MRSFKEMAKLIKEARESQKPAISQSELSRLLGYKNGQFISNVERGLCNIPLKMLNNVSDVLSIPLDDLRGALSQDYAKTVENYLESTVDK